MPVRISKKPKRISSNSLFYLITVRNNQFTTRVRKTANLIHESTNYVTSTGFSSFTVFFLTSVCFITGKNYPAFYKTTQRFETNLKIVTQLSGAEDVQLPCDPPDWSCDALVGPKPACWELSKQTSPPSGSTFITDCEIAFPETRWALITRQC